MNTPRPNYERGLVLYQQKRYKLAIAEFERDLAESPARPDARAMLALSRLNHGDRRGAWAAIEPVLGDAPDYAFGFYAAAHVALAYTPQPKAIKWYRLELTPDTNDVRRRYERARKFITESLRLSPTNAEYLATCATIEAGMQQWGASLEAAERGLAADPAHVECARLRANALHVLGLCEQAEHTIDRAIAANPEAVPVHVARGWQKLGAGEAKTAESHFREALRQNPTNRDAKVGLMQARAARLPPYRWALRSVIWCSNGLVGPLMLLMIGMSLGISASIARDGHGIGLAAAAGVGTAVTIMLLFRPILILRLMFDPVGRRRMPLRQRVIGMLVLLAAVGAFAAVVAYRTHTAVPEMSKLEPWMIQR